MHRAGDSDQVLNGGETGRGPEEEKLSARAACVQQGGRPKEVLDPETCGDNQEDQ
jgi:hypothetical protein